MTAHILTTNGDSYLLPPTTNLRRLRTLVTRAARAGGRFVEIDANGVTTLVLVTPCSKTTIRKASSVVTSTPERASGPPWPAGSSVLDDF